MMDHLRRVLALFCFVSLGLLTAPTAALAAPPVSVSAVASADAVGGGASVTLTATVTGARPTDQVVLGLKTETGWSELEREPAADASEHAFVTSPPVLGRNVFRIGLFRGARLLAASAPVVVTGLIAVDPSPVVRGETVSLSGTLPSRNARPVLLQVQADGDWTTVDADFSDADGSVVFSWTPSDTADVRFVAPARSIDGVAFPRFVSQPVTVSVTAPEPEPSITRASAGLGISPRLSGDGRHLLYTGDPAVDAPAVYSSGYYREDDPVRTRLVPDVGDPASSGYLGISADGRYVLLDGQPKPPGSERGVWALYVWDTTTDAVEKLISFPAGTYGPLNAVISADGSRVAFASTDDSLVPGDDNKLADAYVIDRDGKHLQRISNGADGRALPTGAAVYGISADGSVVVFGTRDALDGDRHSGFDAYRWDAAGRVQLISGNATTAEPSDVNTVTVSEDGRFVGYTVTTGMLVGTSYVFDARDSSRVEVPLPDREIDLRRLVRTVDLSADGGYGLLIYESIAGTSDFYRWERSGGQLELVNGSEFGNAEVGTRVSSGSLSDDGAVIAFGSVPRDGTFRDSAVFVWSVRD